jgi:cytoskeletal protein CcmA (bactofilin family)
VSVVFRNGFSPDRGEFRNKSDGTALAIADASLKGALMQSTSVMGPSITITGDITADEPLTIAGRVDGTVSITGHSLIIEAAGQVNADVQADAVIVGGHVTGSLVATTRIVIRQSAIIDGSLSAPVLTVEDGAQLRGRIDIKGHKNAAALQLAS